MSPTDLRAWVIRGPAPEQGPGPIANETFYVECTDGSIEVIPPPIGGPGRIIGPGSHTEEEIAAAFKRFRHDVQFERCLLNAGEFHPRIWRGASSPDNYAGHVRGLAACMQTARTLFDRQDAIFRTVQPASENANAFGHELRNLLILACTSVEASLKAVLSANDYRRGEDSDKWSTKDYVKLADPMHLREWKLKMPLYVEWPLIQPFAGWSEAEPTRSLPWYHAYNQTKHDAEHKLSVATLNQAINAVAAVFVLLLAQFGPGTVDGYEVAEWPAWSNKELYAPHTHSEAARTPLTMIPLFST